MMAAEPLQVLMADDDDGHATLVRRNLLRAGVNLAPIHLRDGQELLDYVYRRDPWTDRLQHDALAMILDLNMPRLDGVEVLRQLKTDRDVARFPVFVLTTTDNPFEIDRCYDLGAAVCLVKPVDYGAFATMVQRLAHLLVHARMPGEVKAM
jgi:CheY-like chemotaxis protein